jgi:hypothetical protein
MTRLMAKKTIYLATDEWIFDFNQILLHVLVLEHKYVSRRQSDKIKAVPLSLFKLAYPGANTTSDSQFPILRPSEREQAKEWLLFMRAGVKWVSAPYSISVRCESKRQPTPSTDSGWAKEVGSVAFCCRNASCMMAHGASFLSAPDTKYRRH